MKHKKNKRSRKFPFFLGLIFIFFGIIGNEEYFLYENDDCKGQHEKPALFTKPCGTFGIEKVLFGVITIRKRLELLCIAFEACRDQVGDSLFKLTDEKFKVLCKKLEEIEYFLIQHDKSLIKKITHLVNRLNAEQEQLIQRIFDIKSTIVLTTNDVAVAISATLTDLLLKDTEILIDINQISADISTIVLAQFSFLTSEFVVTINELIAQLNSCKKQLIRDTNDLCELAQDIQNNLMEQLDESVAQLTKKQKSNALALETKLCLYQADINALFTQSFSDLETYLTLQTNELWKAIASLEIVIARQYDEIDMLLGGNVAQLNESNQKITVGIDRLGLFSTQALDKSFQTLGVESVEAVNDIIMRTNRIQVDAQEQITFRAGDLACECVQRNNLVEQAAVDIKTCLQSQIKKESQLVSEILINCANSLRQKFSDLDDESTVLSCGLGIHLAKIQADSVSRLCKKASDVELAEADGFRDYSSNLLKIESGLINALSVKLSGFERDMTIQNDELISCLDSVETNISGQATAEFADLNCDLAMLDAGFCIKIKGIQSEFEAKILELLSTFEKDFAEQAYAICCQISQIEESLLMTVSIGIEIGCDCSMVAPSSSGMSGQSGGGSGGGGLSGTFCQKVAQALAELQSSASFARITIAGIQFNTLGTIAAEEAATQAFLASLNASVLALNVSAALSLIALNEAMCLLILTLGNT